MYSVRAPGSAQNRRCPATQRQVPQVGSGKQQAKPCLCAALRSHIVACVVQAKPRTIGAAVLCICTARASTRLATCHGVGLCRGGDEGTDFGTLTHGELWWALQVSRSSLLEKAACRTRHSFCPWCTAHQAVRPTRPSRPQSAHHGERRCGVPSRRRQQSVPRGCATAPPPWQAGTAHGSAAEGRQPR
jgi:hypothetical protein